jgi:hypothetical protein
MATTIIPLRLETSKRYFAALKWLKFRKNPFQKAAEGPRFRAFALRLRTERDLGDRDVDKWSLRLVVERGVLAFECRNWSHLSQVDVLEFVGRFGGDAWLCCTLAIHELEATLRIIRKQLP